MSFYGNISNMAKTQLQFDKIYPSRYLMDSQADIDGVYLNRYVLIEYDKTDIGPEAFNLDKNSYLPGNWKTKKIYTDFNCKTALKSSEPVSKIHKVIQIVSNHNFQDGYELTDDEEIKFGKEYFIKEKDSENNQYYFKTISFNSQNEIDRSQNAKVELLYEERSVGVQSRFFVPTGKDENNELFFTEVFEGGQTSYNNNYKLDYQTYQNERGYDSTVWQKVYVDDEIKYVMIAELNSVIPSFDVSSDAPTVVPKKPHFDGASTNIYYNLHTQPSWGMRLRPAKTYSQIPYVINGQTSTLLNKNISSNILSFPSDISVPIEYANNTEGFKNREICYLQENGTALKLANKNNITKIPAAVYFNADGFNSARVSKSKDIADSYSLNDYIFDNKQKTLKNYIGITPTGYSGNSYNINDNVNIQNLEPDTQELAMILPSLGDTVSDMWDIIYGDRVLNKGDIRNKEISWDDAKGFISRKGLRISQYNADGTSVFYPKNGATIAGCINSVHDALGMIIASANCDENSYKYDENLIYYDTSNKNYKYKDKLVRLIPFTQEDKNLLNNLIEDVQNNNEIKTDLFYEKVDVIDYNESEGTLYTRTLNDCFLATSKEKITQNTIYYEKRGNENNFKSESMFSWTPGVFYKAITDEKNSAKIIGYELDTSQTRDERISIFYGIKSSREIQPREGLYNIYNEQTGKVSNAYEQENFDKIPTRIFIPNYYVTITTNGEGELSGVQVLKEWDASYGDEINAYVWQYRTIEGLGIINGGSLQKIDLAYASGLYPVRLKQYKPETYYSYDGSKYKELTQTEYTEYCNWLKKEINKEGGVTQSELEEIISKFAVNAYTLDIKPYTALYKPNSYYYKENKNYILDTSENGHEEYMDFYYYKTHPSTNEKFVSIFAPKNAGAVNYDTGELEDKTTLKDYYQYEKNKFYKKVGNKFILDSSGIYDKNTDYYLFKKQIYFKDKNGEYFEYDDLEDIYNLIQSTEDVNSLNFYKKEEIYGWKELKNLNVSENTVYGLILKLNKLLKENDALTRDDSTVQGVLNKLKDVLLKNEQKEKAQQVDSELALLTKEEMATLFGKFLGIKFNKILSLDNNVGLKQNQKNNEILFKNTPGASILGNKITYLESEEERIFYVKVINKKINKKVNSLYVKYSPKYNSSTISGLEYNNGWKLNGNAFSLYDISYSIDGDNYVNKNQIFNLDNFIYTIERIENNQELLYNLRVSNSIKDIEDYKFLYFELT